MLEQLSLKGLVFTRYNMWLELRQKEQKKKKYSYDPICL